MLEDFPRAADERNNEAALTALKSGMLNRLGSAGVTFCYGEKDSVTVFCIPGNFSIADEDLEIQETGGQPFSVDQLVHVAWVDEKNEVQGRQGKLISFNPDSGLTFEWGHSTRETVLNSQLLCLTSVICARSSKPTS